MSIQRDHIHLLVEADDKDALSNGVRGFSISAARQINKAITARGGDRRTGRVIADWKIDPFSSGATCSGWKELEDFPILWPLPPTYYPLIVRHTVADPLRLGSLGPDDGAEDPLVAQLYDSNADGPAPAPREGQSARWAGGGLRASAVDLARLAAAHRVPGYLSARTLELLFTSQKTVSGQETGVGLGWRLAIDEHGRRYVHHAGNMPGARSLALGVASHGASGVGVGVGSAELVGSDGQRTRGESQHAAPMVHCRAPIRAMVLPLPTRRWPARRR